VWTLTLGTKVRIQVTQGAVAFANGDTFRFGIAERRFGGRILFEFTVAPHPNAAADAAIAALGVRFDITRQIQFRDYSLGIGAGPNAVGKPPLTGQKTFPFVQTPAQDNELPNDDTHDDDEQNTPVDGHIYVYDSPSEAIINRNLAFIISRNTFLEWVRVRLDSGRFANQAPFGAGAPAARQRVEGSRASDKIAWHTVYYLVRGASGVMVPDAPAISASAPLIQSPTNANGGVVVTPGAAAVTEGFTATYTETAVGGGMIDHTWTLQGTTAADTDSAKITQAGAVAAGATWTLNIGAGGNKVRVVITQGATAFAVGDRVVFSIFKTANAAGKVNDTGVGAFNSVLNPDPAMDTP
jgi:hypothetical protein